MDISKYNQFLEYQNLGRKDRATAALRAFISSFQDSGEIDTWVWKYLPQLTKNRRSRIRHEIFEELIYPTLKAGYLTDHFESTLWLGKLVQNIYQTQKLWEELHYVTDRQLYEKCFTLRPDSNEARLLLLATIVTWLQYCNHEWPAGMLFGIGDGATLEQCGEIRKEMELAKRLDAENNHQSFFLEFESNLIEWVARLNKRGEATR